jgi:hypothetical protein
MAELGDSAKGNTGAAKGKNQAPNRAQLLRHLRPGRRPLAKQMDDTFAAALKKEQALAQPTLDKADKLVADTAIAQPLRTKYTQSKTAYTAAAQVGEYHATSARLREHKAAAVALINGAKAAELKKEQLASQAALHGEVAPVLERVKKISFPEGKAEYIGKQGLDAGKHFKDYLAALAAVEAKKADGQKIVAKGGVTGPAFRDEMKDLCGKLLAAAQAHLDHYEKDLSGSQKADRNSLSKKRYCEEGKLSAIQYLMALEFEAVGDPKASAQGWDEAAQMRAASVRAQLNFHQAFQAAASLKDGGEAAGASDSLWLQGMDFEQTKAAKPGAPQPVSGPTSKPDGPEWTGSNADWKVTQNKRVAIFKPFEGEKPAAGSTDKPGAGAAKEALASANAKLFAAQTGIDLGVPETNVVAIGRYAIGGSDPAADPLEPVVGSAQGNAGARHQINDLPGSVVSKIKPRDVQKLAMLDVMQLNCDRHSGNIMVKFDANGDPVPVPIDHGGSLPKREDFAEVKERIGGITDSMERGFNVVNSLLSLPAAYEPFDPELLTQLELLDPAAIEQGMKRQRSAGAKVPDDCLHMSKRAMMFLKQAAPMLSPAEVQIALAQRGEELFDAADNNFDAVAAQVIADFLPMRQAYKEVFTGALDETEAIVRWLEANKWVAPDGKNSGANFLMANPVLALSLYRAGKPNTSPPPKGLVLTDADRQKVVEPATDDSRTVTDTFKQQYLAQFTGAKPDVDEKTWQKREFWWGELAKAGGFVAYQQILTRTGAGQDASAKDCIETMKLWGQLNSPANAAMLRQLRPTGAGRAAIDFLKGFVKQCKVSQFFAQAEADAATIDVDAGFKAAAEAVLQRVRALATDPDLAASQQPLASRIAAVAAELTKKNWEDAHTLALALDRDALKAALDAVVAIAESETDAVMKRLPDSALAPDLKLANENIVSAAFGKGSLANAQLGLTNLRTTLGKYDRTLANALVFSWDAKAASATKKKAVADKLIPDKDTGMSDALKAVAEAQKGFDAVLADNKLKPEKKRAAGDKAIAAYEKFIVFVNTKLRPLSERFAWKHYCAQGIKAAHGKIASIRTAMDA